MRSLLLSLTALFLGVAALMAGHGLLSTLIAVRMSLEGVASELAGAVMSAYFVGLALGCRSCAGIIERVGHIRTFAAMAGILCITSLLAGLFPSPVAWLALRVVAGFSLAGLFMVAESWLNDSAAAEVRGRVLSLYMIITYLALGAGQLLISTADVRTDRLFMTAAVAFAACLVPVALTRSVAPAPVRAPAFGLGDLYRVSPFGVASCVASGLLTAALYGMGPVFARDMGLPVREVSWFMSIAIASGLVLQWPLGKLSDRVDRRLVIIAVCFATAAVSLGTIPLADTSRLLLMLLAGLFGSLSFTIYPLALAHVNDVVAPSERIPATAGLLLVYGGGAAAGPLLASTMMGRLGPTGLFAFFAAVSLATALYTTWRLTRRPPVPEEEKEPFLSFPRMTPVAVTVDPDAGDAGRAGGP